MVQNRDTQSPFLLGDYNANFVSLPAKREYGSSEATLDLL